jgi:hypothetical protein
MVSGRIRTGLCLLVAVLWATSVARQIFDPTFKPDPAINAVFSTVIGAVVVLGGKDNKEKDDEKPPPKKPRTRT